MNGVHSSCFNVLCPVTSSRGLPGTFLLFVPVDVFPDFTLNHLTLRTRPPDVGCLRALQTGLPAAPWLVFVPVWKGWRVLGRRLSKGAFDLLATLGNNNRPLRPLSLGGCGAERLLVKGSQLTTKAWLCGLGARRLRSSPLVRMTPSC